MWSAAKQRRLDVQPRIRRGFSYALVRAWATVIQRDLQVEAIISDLYAGRPVAYTTFLAYDEVAHHSGIERPDTLTTLRQVDRQIGRIVRAAEYAPRPYCFAVLSDHGQSQGATFRDRYGLSLDELVHRAASAERAEVVAAAPPDEAAAFLGASLAEASAGDSAMSKTVRLASRRHADDGAGETDGNGLPEISVMASGCLGLISFPRQPGRLTLERIETLHPGLVGELAGHPGIGFVLVRSGSRGPLAIGARGVHALDSGTVDGCGSGSYNSVTSATAIPLRDSPPRRPQRRADAPARATRRGGAAELPARLAAA
jgi:hypothetical protein